MYLNIKKNGFTLIELSVVVIIIGILSLIGTIGYSSYLETARDAKRLNDISTISNFLEEYLKTNGTYPLPDKSSTVTWNGSPAWHQGLISDPIALSLKMTLKPSDSYIDNLEYTYSLSANGKQYQLGTINESKTISYNKYNILDNAYAADAIGPTAIVRGTYNQLLLAAGRGGSGIRYIAVPSIILSDTGVLEMNSGSFNTGSFVIDKGYNLPVIYSGSSLFFSKSNSFYFTPHLVGIVNGSQLTDSGIVNIMEMLKLEYSGSTLAYNTNNSIWSSIVNITSGSSKQIDIGRALISGLVGRYSEPTIKISDDGLLASWDFTNGSLNDKSSNGHNLTNYSSSLTGGVFAGDIDGGYFTSGSYLGMPDVSSWAFIGSGITYSLWVKPLRIQNNDFIFNISGGWNDSNGIWIRESSGKFSSRLVFNNSPSNYIEIPSTDNIILNTWQNVVIKYDGAIFGIYINGKLSGSGAHTGNIQYSNTYAGLGIGKWNGVPGFNHYSSCLFDNIRMYNRALSDDEIKTLYDAEDR